MPHPTKKQKIDDHQRTDLVVAAGNNFVASFDDLSIDVVANIFAFLPVDDTMRSRRINKKTREAVKKTIVPPTDFRVNSVRKYNAMNVMTRALPNLQSINLRDLDDRHKWSDGEDPDEEVAARLNTTNWTRHDIRIITTFRNLRVLEIGASLNGRYPFLFNSFPLLQTLNINFCSYLKWDLGMLAGLPLLKELDVIDFNNRQLTGNINSLRVLKDTLEKVYLMGCKNVVGNFLETADFPHLKELNLLYTAVTGDIRDIGNNDFSSLESLALPKTIYGATGSTFQRITDAPELIRAVYLLKKQRPPLKMKDWHVRLSEDSPDWYDSVDDPLGHTLPFYIRFAEAGSRIGYRWEAVYKGNPCEVNWLDPEPDRESSDYAKYTEDLQKIEGQVDLYKGFHQPPTEEEYRRLMG